MMLRIVSVVAFVGVLAAVPARAQSWEAGVYFATSQWSEFDGHDPGIGGRLTFKPLPLLGIDANVTWYPSEFPSGAVPFSGSRVEGLFGATVGPTIARIRPFVSAAAGFLNVAATPVSFACVTIFPPPLACLMAGGQTLPAYAIGGGVDISASSHTSLRVDITDRILKYPGPTFDAKFERRDDGFFGGALRFTIGAALRF